MHGRVGCCGEKGGVGLWGGEGSVGLWGAMHTRSSRMYEECTMHAHTTLRTCTIHALREAAEGTGRPSIRTRDEMEPCPVAPVGGGT